jgi:hypothetical protein
VVNATGSYRPALRITGMTPGLELHLDDLEVRQGVGWDADLLFLCAHLSAAVCMWSCTWTTWR